MTSFWIAAALIAAAAAWWIARPLLSRGQVESQDSDAALSIFRDQLDELQRDREAGLIDAQQLAEAEEEIEARALQASRRREGGVSVVRRAPIAAGLLAGFVGIGGLGGYAALGTPDAPDQALADRRSEMLERRAAAGDLNSRIEILIEKTKQNPDSFEDWWMLGRSYGATGDHASAADAYRRAAELSDDKPSVLSAYAEAMTLANGNKVPQAAKLIFQQILQKAPDPRARYYVALSKAQAQDFEGALADWAALAAESDASAPWMGVVRRDIVNMARFLKREVTDYLPDANPAEIAKAGGAPKDPAALENRAGELEAALADEPKDYKRWIALAETRSALGDDAAAAEAIAQGRKEYAAAPFVIAQFDAASRRLGLDLVVEPGVAGPSDEQVAAAAEMTEEQRADMIAGMVAGLAAKLEADPNNLDGWIMLVRSYATMGEAQKARAAYDQATAHYAQNADAMARLSRDAAPLAGAN